MKRSVSSAPRHPIRVVAQRTGLKPALIRAWENRYQTVGPKRGKGRHRLYSDADVERLILLRQAVSGGRRISQVAGLSDRQLRGMVEEDEAARQRAGLADAEPERPGDPERPGNPGAATETPAPESLAGRLLIASGARARLGVDLESAASPAAVRRIAAELNRRREPDRRLSAGCLHALLLIQEVAARRIAEHSERHGRDLLDSGLTWLAGRFGRQRLERTLARFEELFDLGNDTPPRSERLRPETLLWLVFLWLNNHNPAFAAYGDLFDDSELESETAYRSLLAGLNDFFAEELGDGGHLLTDLRRSLDASARPLDQLETLRAETEPGSALEERLGRAADLLREEERPPFSPFAGPAPPSSPADPPALPERSQWKLSQERPWMANVVLVAKNVLVWLAQLSREFDRDIRRLDQIPDRALEELRELGFNALWLVGLWQRSRASLKLKRKHRADAVASAYSVDRYEPDERLGGEAALDDLERRCRRIGLRLACDMVPNHTGLDSPWVLEHPERFLSVDRPPFPGYRFTGEDLSPDPNVGLWIEDGYEDFSDAAVVFKRLDRRTGKTRYLYHGNDGTSLPWNDTAQLDYTRADVRHAISDQILKLARRFSIIRLDAAMTLTRLHFQRLWYPAPGSGGAVPSRSEHGMSEEEMERLMPRELWAEVVDRLAEEAPDVMLVAEAFWLMEPYFVRRLGVHRVYHSAFLHAVRHERHGELRHLLREHLADEPAELLRHVSFLTTPDEEPAAFAFGKGDKLFAAATLLAALPGTPLFGHGQAHGMIEKYGMDYDRPYYAESRDPAFAERHRRELVPLLARRELFSGVERLRLFEAEDPGGELLDSVFAVVNGDGRHAVLAVINHSGRPVEARIRARSVPVRIDGEPRRCPLPRFDRARDLRSGEAVELLQSPEGLELTLEAYGTRVLVVPDEPGR